MTASGPQRRIEVYPREETIREGSRSVTWHFVVDAAAVVAGIYGLATDRVDGWLLLGVPWYSYRLTS